MLLPRNPLRSLQLPGGGDHEMAELEEWEQKARERRPGRIRWYFRIPGQAKKQRYQIMVKE